MHKILEDVCVALDKLANTVTKAWTDDRTLAEVHGWNHPAVTRHDLANQAWGLEGKIRDANLEEVDEDMMEVLKDVPRKLGLIQTATVPYMFNGNGHQAVPAYMATLAWLTNVLTPYIGWQNLQDKNAMPAPIARRLRSLHAQLESIIPSKEDLEQQIKLIQDATDTAEALPTDLQELKEAKKVVNQIATDSAELFGKIKTNHGDSKTALDNITQQQDEADKLVQKCEEAYRITTTKGLAAAFDSRASQLSVSMRLWAVGLFVALTASAYFGSQRMGLLVKIIEQPGETKPEVIWMNILLTVFSVGAPVWFAWLATKQIGQRFRLAEDYAFKASVAKAYEGYRREAARIDESFEARLFGSALTRLEEAPLRLVESETHGSPWHELISSEVFQNALKTMPELKIKFVEVFKGLAEKTEGFTKAKAATIIKSDNKDEE